MVPVTVDVLELSIVIPTAAPLYVILVACQYPSDPWEIATESFVSGKRILASLTSVVLSILISILPSFVDNIKSSAVVPEATVPCTLAVSAAYTSVCKSGANSIADARHTARQLRHPVHFFIANTPPIISRILNLVVMVFIIFSLCKPSYNITLKKATFFHIL